MICIAHQIFGLSNQEEWDGQGMWHVWETGEIHTWFWLGVLSDGDRLEGVGMVGRIILKRISKKCAVRAWPGLT
jgi:hypothetical protein